VSSSIPTPVFWLTLNRLSIAVSTLALVVGLVVGNVVRPGAGLNVDPATLDTSKVATYITKAHETTLTGFLLNIIPDTMFSAFTSGEIL